MGAQSVANIGLRDVKATISGTKPQCSDARIFWILGSSRLLASFARAQDLVRERILGSVETVLDILFHVSTTLFVFKRHLMSKRTSRTAITLPFDKERTNLCSISFVVRTGSGERHELTIARFPIRQIRSSRRQLLGVHRIEPFSICVALRNRDATGGRRVGQESIANLNGKTVGQIEYAGLANVLHFGAGLTNFGLFIACAGTRFPSKHCKRTITYFTLLSVLFSARRARDERVGGRTCGTRGNREGENTYLIIRTYGLSPRQVSQRIGNSAFSHPSLL